MGDYVNFTTILGISMINHNESKLTIIDNQFVFEAKIPSYSIAELLEVINVVRQQHQLTELQMPQEAVRFLNAYPIFLLKIASQLSINPDTQSAIKKSYARYLKKTEQI